MQPSDTAPQKVNVKNSESSFVTGAKRILASREMGVLLALIVLIIAMRFLSPYFLRTNNIFNVLRGMSTIGIMAIGQTMIIVTAGIDLSVGSILAASSMVAARLMFLEIVPPGVAVLIGLLFGTGLGLINGLIITKLGVNPFITTLGMLSIARGLAYLLATGLQGTVASNIPMRNDFVTYLGKGYVGPVPVPVIVMVILVIIFSLFLRYTVLGRQIYAVGSNEQAARLSGVPVSLVKTFVYTITGTLCALSGILTAGLLATSQTSAGVGVELDVIAAVVIGGASLAGGEGSIIGAVIGAAIMAVLRNAFVLLKLPIYLQTITIGLVIIVAVAADNLRRRRQ